MTKTQMMNQPEQQHEVSNMEDINTLSISLKWLSVSNTRLPPLENDQVLRKNNNIPFKLKNRNNWKTVTLISRLGKANGKYKKAWDSKLDDKTMQSIDYEKDAVSLEHLPKSSASNATNPQTNTKEVLCSKIYLIELENQTTEAKMAELGNWKKQNVYREEEDMGQSCISVRWVLSQKVKNGQNITKARLFAILRQPFYKVNRLIEQSTNVP